MATIQEMVQEDLAKLKDSSLEEIATELKAVRLEYRTLMQKEDIGLDENRKINFLMMKISELERLIKEKKQ